MTKTDIKVGDLVTFRTYMYLNHDQYALVIENDPSTFVRVYLQNDMDYLGLYADEITKIVYRAEEDK